MQECQDRGLGKELSTSGGLAAVAAAWLAFGLAHALVRLAFDHSLSPADSLEVIAAQDFRISYRAAQPPLFTWALWASNEVLGPTQLSLQLVKYFIMLVAGLLFYLASLAATADRALSVMASLSMLLLFNVGLSIHDQSTHSIALIAALGGLVYGYALLAQAPSFRAYAVIAAAMIAGFLSKHSFGVIAVAMPLAFMLDRELRSRILSWRFTVMLLVAAVALTPFLAYMLAHRADAASRLSKTLHGSAAAPMWQILIMGQVQLVGGLAIVIGPLMLALAFVFPGFWKNAVAAHRAIIARQPGDIAIDVLRAAWIATLAVAIAVAALAAERVPSRHLLMIVLPAALAMVWLVARSGPPSRKQLRAMLGVVAVSQTALMGVRLGTYVAPGWPFCSGCHHLIPVGRLAELLKRRGLGSATLVVEEPVTGANLLPHMPSARVVLLRLPKAAAPHVKIADQARTCALVRLQANAADIAMHPSFRAALNGASPSMGDPVAVVRLPRNVDGQRSYTWSVTKLDPNSPLCAMR